MPGHLLDLYAAADIPETEQFGPTRPADPGAAARIPHFSEEQFGRPDKLLYKLASSAAHVAGRRLVSSESATWLGEHFQVSLAQVKPEFDQLFLGGINHIFFHGIPFSPAARALARAPLLRLDPLRSHQLLLARPARAERVHLPGAVVPPVGRSGRRPAALLPDPRPVARPRRAAGVPLRPQRRTLALRAALPPDRAGAGRGRVRRRLRLRPPGAGARVGGRPAEGAGRTLSGDPSPADAPHPRAHARAVDRPRRAGGGGARRRRAPLRRPRSRGPLANGASSSSSCEGVSPSTAHRRTAFGRRAWAGGAGSSEPMRSVWPNRRECPASPWWRRACSLFGARPPTAAPTSWPTSARLRSMAGSRSPGIPSRWRSSTR